MGTQKFLLKNQPARRVALNDISKDSKESRVQGTHLNPGDLFLYSDDTYLDS